MCPKFGAHSHQGLEQAAQLARSTSLNGRDSTSFERIPQTLPCTRPGTLVRWLAPARETARLVGASQTRVMSSSLAVPSWSAASQPKSSGSPGSASIADPVKRSASPACPPRCSFSKMTA
jgi:hypothetical protein